MLNPLRQILTEVYNQRRQYDSRHDSNHSMHDWILLFAKQIGDMAAIMVGRKEGYLDKAIVQLGALCISALHSYQCNSTTCRKCDEPIILLDFVMVVRSTVIDFYHVRCYTSH
jgi:hypothetical protein